MPATDAIRQDPRAAARDVLGIVSGLVGELGGRSGDRPVRLDDVLDRDLGIGSLERVELLVRLEQRYGVRLPDAVVVLAVFCPTLLAGGPPAVFGGSPPRPPGWAPPTPAPAGARSLVEALGWHAHATPERVHIFLRDEDGRERPITYGSLWQRAQGVAASLRERRLGRGDTVAIMLRTEEAFFHAFFGVLMPERCPCPSTRRSGAT